MHERNVIWYGARVLKDDQDDEIMMCVERECALAINNTQKRTPLEKQLEILVSE